MMWRFGLVFWVVLCCGCRSVLVVEVRYRDSRLPGAEIVGRFEGSSR